MKPNNRKRGTLIFSRATQEPSLGEPQNPALLGLNMSKITGPRCHMSGLRVQGFRVQGSGV